MRKSLFVASAVFAVIMFYGCSSIRYDVKIDEGKQVYLNSKVQVKPIQYDEKIADEKEFAMDMKKGLENDLAYRGFVITNDNADYIIEGSLTDYQTCNHFLNYFFGEFGVGRGVIKFEFKILNSAGEKIGVANYSDKLGEVIGVHNLYCKSASYQVIEELRKQAKSKPSMKM